MSWTGGGQIGAKLETGSAALRLDCSGRNVSRSPGHGRHPRNSRCLDGAPGSGVRVDECRNLDCHCHQSDSLRTHRTICSLSHGPLGIAPPCTLRAVAPDGFCWPYHGYEIAVATCPPLGCVRWVGLGVTSLVLAAVIANRWFDKHRGP